MIAFIKPCDDERKKIKEKETAFRETPLSFKINTFGLIKHCLVIAIFMFFMTGCSSRSQLPYAVEVDDTIYSSPSPGVQETLSLLQALHPGNTQNPAALWNRHVIAIDYRGEFKPITFQVGSKTDTAYNADQHIAQILGDFQRSGKETLMLFIHGGLNDYDDSINKRVRRDLLSIIHERQDVYPVFIVWPSEMFDAYEDSLENYKQGAWDPNFKTGMPVEFVADVGTIAAKSPLSYFKQGQLWLNSRCFDDSYANWFSWFCKPWSPEVAAQERNPANDPCQEPTPKRGFICANTLKPTTAWDYDIQWKKLPSYLARPLKLVSIPVIDPLGYRDWHSLIGRTRFAMLTACRDGYPRNGDCKTGVIQQFLNATDTTLQTLKSKKIEMIAHSMGTIVASEIVARFPNLPYSSVVFMGAAVSFREFENTVLKTLASRASNGGKLFEFFNLSLDPYAEATEENGYGAAPSGSLLEWITYNFTAPANLLDRPMGRWVDIAAMSPYIAASDLLGRNVFFKRFGLDHDSPHAHGDLANPETCGFYWDKRYWHGESLNCANLQQHLKSINPVFASFMD